MIKSIVDWGEGLVKYVCGCKQVMGENICPVHQEGITRNSSKDIMDPKEAERLVTLR